VISADVLCANVTTILAPGTSTATSAVANVTIGVPGLPVITATAIKATSTTTCAAASGTTTITNLTIGGVPVNLNVPPNTGINVAGLAQLVINEQVPVPGADKGLTVNALHLTGLGGAVDVVVASATSDAHNC
ncbi:MAG TPA: choice-of-anchor P family protein, partial [Pseudonocardiaceae bacterium]